MTDADLGQATIVYEAPDGKTVDETVDNEYVAYFQDHWIVKTDEDDDGQDVVRRIPATRVYYVERNVEEFEEEIGTLRDQVQSVATDISGEIRTLRDRIESVAGGLQQRRDEERTAVDEEDAQPIEIEVGEGERTGDSGTDAGEEGDADSDVDRSL